MIRTPCEGRSALIHWQSWHHITARKSESQIEEVQQRLFIMCVYNETTSYNPVTKNCLFINSLPLYQVAPWEAEDLSLRQISYDTKLMLIGLVSLNGNFADLVRL